MESVSILDFNKMPEIRTKVLSTEILHFNRQLYKALNCSQLFIMLSGSATYKIIHSPAASKENNFPANSIVFLPPNKELEIKSTSHQCQVLHIVFDLYTMKDSDDATGEIYPENTVRYRKLNHLFNCSSISSFESSYPYFHSDIQNLIAHCKLSPVNYNVLHYSLEKVLYTILHVQFSTTVDVLKSIRGIAISNGGYQLKMPFRCTISDITVWSCSPRENKQAEKLFTAFANHFYIESPKDKSSYTFTVNDETPQNGNLCELVMTSGGRFKLWLFPDSETPSLEDYKSTGVITFKLWTNRPCTLTLQLYHIPSYQCISYRFDVKESETYNEYEIPISQNAALNTLPPYVEKAVQFIQENYAEKITIQDIADYVRIHPSYLSAIFRKNLNQSVNSYINFHRINIAKQLLRNSDISITDIALQTGFYDAQHFLKTFKKNTGLTPSEYRNME
ncbi:MAG: helix-turn-helix transcriptional regulator [Acutalibacteraceae bacterium]|jgi:AraC-like DNA-binding protein